MHVITGAQPKAGIGHKMQSVPDVLPVTLWGIYRWLTFGSAHWLIEILSAILKSGRQLLGERPLRCTNLRAKIQEWIFGETNFRAITSEPSIVKLIENKSDLSKLSTFSESSIVKCIENQSEHLSTLTSYHLKKRATRRSRRAREPSRIPLLFHVRKKFVFNDWDTEVFKRHIL